MRRYQFLLIMAFALLSTSAVADYITVENTSGVRAGYTHQFSVRYHDGETVIDITSDAQFSSLGPATNLGQGRFVFEPGRGGYNYYATINVSYSTPDGNYFSDSDSFNVDSRPSFITIIGGSMTYPGRSLYLRAYGTFGSKRYDLTYDGRWSANMGRASNGWYTAPNSPYSNSDTVYFYYGSYVRTQHISIIRN